MEATTFDGQTFEGEFSKSYLTKFENTSQFKQSPFFIQFSRNEKIRTLTIPNDEDVLKMADVFSEFLTKNGIENFITDKI